MTGGDRMGIEIALNTGESFVWAILFFGIGVLATYVIQTYKLTKRLSAAIKEGEAEARRSHK